MPRNPNFSEIDVFINCPFDEEFKPLLYAMVFTLLYVGLRPRFAQEDSGIDEVRLEKIIRLIASSKYGVHDISRVELDGTTKLPRFNMPFELGIDLGCKKFGNRKQKTKKIFVFDKEKFRYRMFISDLGGCDIEDHSCDPCLVIHKLRNWVATTVKVIPMPDGATKIIQRWETFFAQLPMICAANNTTYKDLIYPDYLQIARVWLQENLR